MAIKTFTTGEVLTASDTNTFLTNSGLVFVKSDTITSGSSKEITGAFSSTYNNYRIVLSNMRTAGAVGLSMRMGTDATGIYYYSGQYGLYTSTSITGINGAGVTNIDLSTTVTNGVDSACIIDIFSPNQAKTTSFIAWGQDPRTNGGANRMSSGFVNNTTQYTSFTILNSGASAFSSCDVAVYGYRLP